MKLKLWQWLVSIAVVVVLVLVGIALGHKWRGGNSAANSNVNQQSLQPPQNTKVPTPPTPVNLQ